MKLATFRDGSRDGLLGVVSRDLKTAHVADGIAPTMQAALDDWAFIAPQLRELSDRLNAGKTRRGFDFNPAGCMAPLPRAYGWVSGAAYVHHVELLMKARGVEMPASFWDEPLLSYGNSDGFLGPHDDIVVAHESWGVDFGAQVAVILGDVPMGATPDDALAGIRLVTLANDVTLRNLMSDELAKGFGFVQSRPMTSFAPVAVTPDELGDAWRDAKLHLPLRTTRNEKLVGQLDAGVDMAFNFAQLVAHVCRTRHARAGMVVCSGEVTNRDAKRGYACIAEKRALEVLAGGVETTPYLAFGDSIRVECVLSGGESIFGAIAQSVVAKS